MTFCKNYVEEALAPYKGDPNVLGFFSDNEINFSTGGSNILDQFLKIADENDLARKAADAFMKEKGAEKIQLRTKTGTVMLCRPDIRPFT